MRRNWLVLLLVCLALIMMAVLPGCRSKKPTDPGDDPKVGALTIDKAGTHDFKVADLTWEKVKDPVNASLSEMKAYDADNPNENEIETDPKETKPDFTKVSGGGFYIVDGDSEGNIMFTSFKWEGAGDSVEDTFQGFGEKVGAYEIIQSGKIFTVSSPDSGYPWTAYSADWASGAILAQVDKYYDGRIKLYGSGDSNKGTDGEETFTAEGSYVYTIFTVGPEMKEEVVGQDDEGEDVYDAIPEADWTPGDPDKELDMTEGTVTIVFGTESPVAYPILIKLMLRDANGDWYLGAPVGSEDPGEDEEEEEEPKEVAEINESFDWTGYEALVGWGQSSVIRVSDATGFPWTGYSPTGGENNPITSDEHWGSRIKFEKDQGGNVPGNYVFTIFDSRGGNDVNRWVDMTAGTMEVSLDQEGEDGAFPMGIKILARDGDGNWFLSDADEVNKGDNSITFADLAWEEVDSVVAEWMNKMEAGDASAYEMTTGDVATPDLTEVTGGGIYIDSITDETKASINLTAIKWTAGE